MSSPLLLGKALTSVAAKVALSLFSCTWEREVFRTLTFLNFFSSTITLSGVALSMSRKSADWPG